MKKIIIALSFISFAVIMQSQPIMVNSNTYTNAQLVTDVLISGCLQAGNVTYIGDPLSIGYFADPGNNFDFAAGVILSSGYISDAPGPNNSTGITGNTTGPSDPLLNAIIPQTTNDAASLEFDFIPSADSLFFRYLFGSDEYPEFVNSSFNDVFAFFLSGPNPGGGNYINYNVALIPGTTTPVSINNVNNGQNSPPTGPCVNCAYYFDNLAVSNPNPAVEYDGLTTPLVAIASVVPCATYHIKLAVADAGDSILDSAVFLEAGSFVSGGQINMENFGAFGGGYDLYEGCENYYIFTRTDTSNNANPLPIFLTITGTTDPATDYILTPPGQIIIPPGQNSTTLFYQAIFDNIAEGTETMIFTLMTACPCGNGAILEYQDTVYIYDNENIVMQIDQPDTLICSTQAQSLDLHALTNTHPSITHYIWSTGSTDSIITVQPPIGAITTYSVTVTDECGQFATDDVTITFSDMSTISISTVDLVCNNVCNGSAVVTPASGFAPYTYNWLPGGVGSLTIGEAFNLCSGNYNVTVIDQFGCTASDNFIINQPPAMVLTFSSVPASCPGVADGSLTVTVTNGAPPYTFMSTSSPFPVTVNANNYTFAGIQSGNYTIEVTDMYGCVVVDISNVDELELTFTTDIDEIMCFGDNDASVTANINGGTPPYQYEWSTGQSGSATINNLSAGNYYVTVTDDHFCQIVVPFYLPQPDSLYINVSTDTLMCRSETANLWAQVYGGTTPYSFIWDSGDVGDTIQVSPDESTIYSVYVQDNNGCISLDGKINVNLFPAISTYIYTSRDSICKGESTLIYAEISGGNGGPYTLGLDNGTIVESPFSFSPENTTILTAYAMDECGSQIGIAILPIYVMEAPTPDVSTDFNFGCPPLQIQFNDNSPDEGQTYIWYFGQNDDGYSVARNPIYTYDNEGIYDVSVEVTSKYGCKNSITLGDFIEVYSAPEAYFMPTPQTASIIRPNIFFENLTEELVNSYWIFGDGDTSNLESPEHKFSDTGTFKVSLIVTNSGECVDTISELIYINNEFTFWAPTAFYPQGDNPLNKTFMPIGIGIDQNNFHLIIYDRWGSKVFETYTPDHGWNGKINNSEIGPSGSYPWVLIYKDKNGGNHKKTGSVFLLN
ncbi:MAG: PKD domain-containing protein, partial [Bacteroidetes bacterium]|nr:PKD domain-containing protein [Bacteroidota bacterium]